MRDKTRGFHRSISPDGVPDRPVEWDDLHQWEDAEGQLTIELSETESVNSALIIRNTVDVLEIDGGQTAGGEERNVTISAAGLGTRVLEINRPPSHGRHAPESDLHQWQ